MATQRKTCTGTKNVQRDALVQINKVCNCFKYLCDKFPARSQAKLKEGINFCRPSNSKFKIG